MQSSDQPGNSVHQLLSLIVLLCAPALQAATPGLPFTEDFSDSALNHAEETNALWSTSSASVRLPSSRAVFGSFDDATTNTVSLESSGSYDIKSADINGDGSIDIVSCAYTGIKVYLHNHTATPYSNPAIRPTSGCTDVAIVDLNHDGLLDLAVADGYVKVYLNQGTGVPFSGLGQRLENIDYLANSIAVGDVNGDGHPDLVAGNFQLANRIYLNNGTSQPFTNVSGAFIDPEISDETRSTLLVDINRDGRLDLIFGNDGAHNLLYLNNGSATTPFISSFSISNSAHSTQELFPIDLNNDGLVDLVEGNSSSPNFYLLNTGTTSKFFDAQNDGIITEFPIGTDLNSATRSIEAGDIDNDGDIDIISANNGAANLVYINNGSPTTPFGDPGINLLSQAYQTFGIELVDLDKDGDLDLLEGTFSGADLVHYNGSSQNVFNGVIPVDAFTETTLSTRAVKIVDVNRDGYPDVVKAHFGLSNRIYYHNTTDDPYTTSGVNIAPTSDLSTDIEHIDLDRDGDIDFVVANYSGQTNSYYLNNGSGVFSKFDFGDTDSSWDLEIGDFNNDGWMDIVFANIGGMNKIYLNNKSATPFSGVSPLQVSSDADASNGVAIDDFNGDGYLDVAFANDGELNKLYINAGSPTYFSTSSVAQTVSADSENSRSIMASDLNNDGLPDLVVGNLGQANKYYLNDGDGIPFDSLPGVQITADAGSTYHLLTVDLNKDGKDDVVAVNYSGQLNRVYMNRGPIEPFFAAEFSYDLGTETDFSFSVSAGDIDRDGSQDIVVGNLSGATDRVYFSTAGGNTFTGISDETIGPHTGRTIQIRVADINNDGHLDVVTGGENESNYATLNNGSESPFVGATSYTVLSGATYIDFADLNNDGLLDYIAGFLNSPNRIMLNDGSAQPFGSGAGSSLPGSLSADRTVDAIAGDVNNDGLVDIIFSNLSEQLQLYLNDGNLNPFSTLVSPTLFGPTGGRTLELADFNSDSYLDLVLSGNQLILNNKTSNPFNGAAISLGGSTSSTVAIGDVNRDGKLDLVIGVPGQLNKLLLNTGTLTSPAFTSSDIHNEAFSTSHVTLADIDHDGDLDVLEANGQSSAQRNKIYYNNGTATPFAPTKVEDITTNSFNTWEIRAADMNHDGLLEIVEANTWFNRIYTRNHFQLPGAEVRSLAVDDTTDNIFRATLTSASDQPSYTDIDYFLSNDGGGTFFRVNPGQMFNFPTSGSDLRWRAILSSSSLSTSPRLDSIQIAGNALPTFVSQGTLVGNPLVGSTIGIVGVATADVEGDTVEVTYQWQSNGVNITGETGTTLEISQALAHSAVRCMVTLNDGFGGLASSPTQPVTVGNTRPVAVIDYTSTIEDTPFTTANLVTDNDTDADGDPLTVINVSSPTGNGGSVTINASENGRFDYTPATNFFGLDTFTYQISDGNGGTANATVNVIVSAVNDNPLISGSPSTSVDPGSSYSFSPIASDADNDAMVFSIANKPAWADFDPSSGQLSGVPSVSHIGNYSGIVIRVTDGTASALLPAFAITVNDTAAPRTTASQSAGAYQSSFLVTLTCSDTGSGCANTFYTLDDPNVQGNGIAYSGPLSISANTTLRFYSVDGDGNIESPTSVSYVIDNTSPSLDLVSPINGSYISGLTQVSGTTGDDNSGVTNVQVQITDGVNSVVNINGTLVLIAASPEWLNTALNTGTGAWNLLTSTVNWQNNKAYTISMRAVDAAGNLSLLERSFTYFTGAYDNPTSLTLNAADLSVQVDSLLTFGGRLSTSNGFNLVGQSVTLNITTPGGATTPVPVVLDNTTGTYSIPDIGIFNSTGTYTIQASYAGIPGVLQPSLSSILSLYVYPADGDNPAVAITAPTDGSYQGSLLQITGTASDSTAGIETVEVLITDSDGLFGITRSGSTLLFSTSASWIPVNSLTGNNWTLITSGIVGWQKNTSYIITARAIDFAGNTSISTSTFTFFDGGTSTSSITINVSDSSVQVNTPVTITGQLVDIPDNGLDLQDKSITLTVTAPDASTSTHSASTDATGQFTFNALSDFSAPGNYNVAASFAGIAPLGGSTSNALTIYSYAADSTGPVVQVSSPVAGSYVKTQLSITGTATDTGSAIETIRIQVTDGSNSLVLINGSAVLFPGAPQWIPATLTGNQWSVGTGFVNWSEDTEYNLTVSAIDFAGNETQSLMSFTYFTADPEFTEIPELVLSSKTILQQDALTVSGILTYPGNTGFYLGDLPIQIKVTSNDGTVTTLDTVTYDAAGHFTYDIAPQNSIFNLKGAYEIRAHYAGNARLLTSKSPASSILVGTSAGYAVIVEGKLLPGEEGLASHNKSANRIYQTLINRGFLDENIWYLNYDNSQAGVDESTSKSAMQNAIENWLPGRVNGSPAPMYIIGVDHGNVDTFYLGNETVSGTELDTWIDTLESKLNANASTEPRIVIYGACYSGSFIPPLSADNRTIITSAAANEESYKGAEEPDGIRVGEYFLEEYFQELEHGLSLKEAFVVATERTEIYTRAGDSNSASNIYFDSAVQHPLLDDNADGVGSNALVDNQGDGQVADTMFLGAGLSFDTNSADNPAEFDSVNPPLYLDLATTGVTLSGTTNVPGNQVTAAWIEIRVPTHTVATGTGATNQLTNNLVRAEMSFDGVNNRWTWTFNPASPPVGLANGFSTPGTYEVYYFAQDSATNAISTAKISRIYKDNGTNRAPLAFRLLSPAAGASTKTVFLLDWEDAVDPDGDAVKYNLYIATTNSFGATTVVSKMDLSSSSAFTTELDGLLDSSTYYWRVEAVDRFGGRISSTTRSFNTDNTNGLPGIIQGLVYSGADFARLSGANIANSLGDVVQVEFDGKYILIASPGSMSVIGTADGYETLTFDNVNVQAGQVTEVNFRMTALPGSTNSGGTDTGGSDSGGTDTGGNVATDNTTTNTTPPPADSGGGGGGGALVMPMVSWTLLLALALYAQWSRGQRAVRRKHFMSWKIQGS